VYDRARLYATTIDDVPAVVTALSAKNFAVMSETGRITEIQQQDNSLQLLVWVVGVGVFFFGIITVFSVLMDATDRKRATVGILRVMGVSRSGVFMTILLRSAVIGVAAALASIAVGFGISQFLAWTPPSSVTWAQLKPIVAVSIAPLDLLFVAGGAVGCCCLGAIPPAWKASRLDPFDAIVEGRFH
jgi:putative ABC transport system permease protein